MNDSKQGDQQMKRAKRLVVCVLAATGVLAGIGGGAVTALSLAGARQLDGFGGLACMVFGFGMIVVTGVVAMMIVAMAGDIWRGGQGRG